MKTSRHKRAALMSCGTVLLLLLIPVCLTAFALYRQQRQERLNRALIAAVKANDDKAVVSLLNLGTSANCRDEPLRKLSFWQTVMQAFRSGRSQPSHAPTPLLIALEGRELPDSPELFAFPPENAPLIRALLTHGAQVNQTDMDGETPLLLAIEGGKNDTVRLLLARGANLHAQGSGDYLFAPLVEAAANSEIEPGVIADMLDGGAEVNQCDSRGETALSKAVPDRADVVRLLLARHADVTVGCGGMQQHSLIYVARRNDTPASRQIVRVLKAAGARE